MPISGHLRTSFGVSQDYNNSKEKGFKGMYLMLVVRKIINSNTKWVDMPSFESNIFHCLNIGGETIKGKKYLLQKFQFFKLTSTKPQILCC